ncbi:4028_t:CDS:2 [Rhizophagus irregularis]|nr:4028_t:CDS:2 [Rhizophagus irregularis]
MFMIYFKAKRVSYSSFPCNSHLIVNEEPPCLPLQNEQGTNERYNDNDLIQPVPFLEQEGKYKKIIWVKFNEEPVKIAFSGEDVSDLVEEAKIKLNGLDNFKMDLIGVYKHNSIEPLKFGQIVDDSFINRYETPIEIKVKKEDNEL